MSTVQLNENALPQDADWEGNNAAFTCRHCGKVFIVSAQIHRGERRCPKPGCGRSVGRVSTRGGRLSGGYAVLSDWPEPV